MVHSGRIWSSLPNCDPNVHSQLFSNCASILPFSFQILKKNTFKPSKLFMCFSNILSDDFEIFGSVFYFELDSACFLHFRRFHFSAYTRRVEVWARFLEFSFLKFVHWHDSVHCYLVDWSRCYQLRLMLAKCWEVSFWQNGTKKYSLYRICYVNSTYFQHDTVECFKFHVWTNVF